jgi:hypothetical protein
VYLGLWVWRGAYRSRCEVDVSLFVRDGCMAKRLRGNAAISIRIMLRGR